MQKVLDPDSAVHANRRRPHMPVRFGHLGLAIWAKIEPHKRRMPRGYQWFYTKQSALISPDSRNTNMIAAPRQYASCESYKGDRQRVSQVRDYVMGRDYVICRDLHRYRI